MSKQPTKPAGLPVVHERAAGIDVGARSHVVGVPPDLCDEPVQTFQAFIGDIERIADGLVSMGIRTVAMESTGVYWISVYEVLEERGVEIIVANAREARAVPSARATRTTLSGFRACTPADCFGRALRNPVEPSWIAAKLRSRLAYPLLCAVRPSFMVGGSERSCASGRF